MQAAPPVDKQPGDEPVSAKNADRSSSRLDGLDGLRGLAALAVFGVHYNQVVAVDARAGPFDLNRLLVNGEHGVALFFVLSGLLLSRPFWKSVLHGADWPDTRTYVIRRLARILPAYYLSLTLLIVLAGYWRHPQAWPDILLHYSFLFNYAEFSIFSINAPYWTLAVEVQFYCLLPLLFLALRTLSPRNIVLVLLLFATVTYALNVWLVSSVERYVYWPGNAALTWLRPYGAVVTHSLLAHLPHFIIGVLGGGLLLKLNDRHSTAGDAVGRRFEAVFWIAFVLVFILLSTAAGDRIQVAYGRYGLPLVPLLLAAMVVSAPFTSVARGLLDSRPVQVLGTLSYGFYIYHLPLLRLVDRTMAGYGMDAREHWAYLGISALALSLLAAAVSHRLIERPVLRLAHRRAGG